MYMLSARSEIIMRKICNVISGAFGQKEDDCQELYAIAGMQILHIHISPHQLYFYILHT